MSFLFFKIYILPQPFYCVKHSYKNLISFPFATESTQKDNEAKHHVYLKHDKIYLLFKLNLFIFDKAVKH